jgi:exoribonuclease R
MTSVDPSKLEAIFGMKQVDEPPSSIRGILQTKDYDRFMILSDVGTEIHTFQGAKLANQCLPGDHVAWVNGRCQLELRDEHPPIVGTIELTSKSRYGMTKRGVPIYLFTPYDKRYPHFYVGCSEKDLSHNRIGIVAFDHWKSTFPRGNLQQLLGRSGDEKAERDALIWQACPWKYPVFDYKPKQNNTFPRTELEGFTFHIDPPGCRDVDDVFTFQALSDQQWKVTITISDVSLFVEDGGAVDIMASLISQTLYDTDGKVLRPMLPSDYSEQVCSLLPGKKSYGISLSFLWDGTQIEDPKWFHSVLTVDQSYTYEEFQESTSPYRVPLKDIASYLGKEQLDDAHDWVAQLMLYYNTEAGKMLKEAKQGILRRHSAPDLERWAMYEKNLPELVKLAYQSAEYCLGEEENTQHYGIQTDAYAHASSPIRRYADLVNQRVLSNLIRGSKEVYIVPQAMYDMNLRGKAMKRFARDMDFLKAIITGETRFEAVILETLQKSGGWTKVKLYVPQWKRSVSTTYQTLSENRVLSRDEKTEIDITPFKAITIHCAFSPNARNWKERVLIRIDSA